jgi:hypothetical protein
VNSPEEEMGERKVKTEIVFETYQRYPFGGVVFSLFSGGGRLDGLLEKQRSRGIPCLNALLGHILPCNGQIFLVGGELVL